VTGQSAQEGPDRLDETGRILHGDVVPGVGHGSLLGRGDLLDEEPVPSMYFGMIQIAHHEQNGRLDLAETLDELCEEFAGEGLAMVAVRPNWFGSSDEELREYIAENELAVPVAAPSDNKTLEPYDVSSVPILALVIGGNIVWRGHPAMFGREILEGVLAPART
jgi:hypothetical protein